MRFVAALIAALLFIPSSAPDARNTSAAWLDRPFGRAKAIVSPDGQHALWGESRSSQLWTEDSRTHADRLIGTFAVQTISLAWSPDSRHFVVNDRETSSESDAYLFDTSTLQRIDLRSRLVDAMPEATHYLLSSKPDADHGMVSHGRAVLHSYLDVLRWTDDTHVVLALHGDYAGRFRHDNTDGRLDPAGCFDLQLRMGLDGSVQRTAEHADQPAGAAACGWGDVAPQ